MKLTYYDPSKENWFLITWTLSNKCNYRCSYCPSFLNNGSTGQPKWETVETFIRNFKLTGKKICYRISGGEPTYWKHFLDMAKLIKNEGHSFTFLTNGSQSVDYYKEISKYSDGIMISYHEEYASVDHFIKIANSIDCPVVVNLMMVKEKFETLLDVAKTLYDNTDKLSIWPKVVLDKTSVDYVTNEVSEYTDQQKEILKKWPYFRPVDDSNIHRGNLMLDNNPINGNDLILKGLNKYKGWECWAGQHMISIDMWGNLYRSECRQGGSFGNLERYTMPDSTIICGQEKCSCLSDIYLKKESRDIT